MAYFKDLTPYTYFPLDNGDAEAALNVGWLDTAHPFETGETSAEFRAKLERLCRFAFNQTRGIHPCYFCAGRKGDVVPTSSAEIRVADDRTVYAAPTLIYHYVAVHNYRPPDEFIAAVLAWDGTPYPGCD